MPKQTLRRQMLARRSALGHADWQLSSREAQIRLMALEEYAAADCVALYMAVRGEVDTRLILEDCIGRGRRVLVPAVCGDRMVFRPALSADQLQPGCFGIPEPCPSGPDHDASTAALIVVPGVAFDLAGHRLGHGRGYYDRFLDHRERKGHLVGLCHEFQIVQEPLPVEGHDIRMEIIVTGERIIRCGRNRC